MTVDSDRLARGLHLDVSPLTAGSWWVEGGAQPHSVKREGRTWHCDCADAELRGAKCKHVLAVKLGVLDPELRAALQILVPPPRRRKKVAA